MHGTYVFHDYWPWFIEHFLFFFSFELVWKSFFFSIQNEKVLTLKLIWLTQYVLIVICWMLMLMLEPMKNQFSTLPDFMLDIKILILYRNQSIKRLWFTNSQWSNVLKFDAKTKEKHTEDLYFTLHFIHSSLFQNSNLALQVFASNEWLRKFFNFRKETKKKKQRNKIVHMMCGYTTVLCCAVLLEFSLIRICLTNFDLIACIEIVTLTLRCHTETYTDKRKNWTT